jgi:acyl dehydratase
MNGTAAAEHGDGHVMRVGSELPAVALSITRELVSAFSTLAQDRNATHYDDAVARAQGFPAALAHGAIAASLALRVLTRNGTRPFRSGDDVQVVFVAPVPVGETLWGRARVIEVQDDCVGYDVWCENASGQKVIAGQARLRRA